MNKTQEYIVEILNHSIHNKKIELDKNEDISWKDILEECKSHNIEALVYYGIHSNTLKTIDKEILESWKKQTFMSNIYQINHIKQISNILSIFNGKNIPVIVLKGLVIRDLYPKSELRTMGDADILVHEQDLNKVKEILKDMEYEEVCRHGFHIVFCKGNSHIEVHWTISDEEIWIGLNEFTDEVWNNAIEVNVEDSKSLSMNYEDLLFHLIIHKANHLKSSGFGIRQICDVALLVDKKREYINWNEFINKLKRSKIDKFAMIILEICNKLFEIEFPKELEYMRVKNEIYTDILIDIIFLNGVHGKKEIISSVAKYFSDSNQKNNFITGFINMYFPSQDKLTNRYSYAKNNKLFLPIAWIHRLLNAIFRRDFRLSEKVKISIQGSDISKRYGELLNWLEL